MPATISSVTTMGFGTGAYAGEMALVTTMGYGVAPSPAGEHWFGGVIAGQQDRVLIAGQQDRVLIAGRTCC